MAISAKVPKDLSGIKTKAALGLTKRQLVCFGSAALIGVPIYVSTKNFLGVEGAMMLMMAVMMPFFFLGVYEKDGYPAEKLFYFMVRQKFLLPGIRPYVQENIFLHTVAEEKTENKAEKKAPKKFLVFWNTPQKKKGNGEKKPPDKKDRKKLIPDTAQKTIGFRRMYQDGICKVSLGYYTKMMQFWDINYELLSEDERRAILSQYSDFINFFDAGMEVQLFLFNRQVDGKKLMEQVEIKPQSDGQDEIRAEVSGMLKDIMAKGNNSIVKSKYFIFGIKAKTVREARSKFAGIEADMAKNFMRMGVRSKVLSGVERLAVLHEYFHQDLKETFHFSYREAAYMGSSIADCIAPDGFDFRNPAKMRIGAMHGKVLCVNFLSANLDDSFLRKMIAIENNVTVSIHMNTMEPVKAVKLVKNLLSEVQKMKVDEQKNAVNRGYDMEIMPPDIIAYEQELLELIDDLNSRNQKVVWTMFLVSCFGMTNQKMEQVVQRVSGIVEQAGCGLIGLRYQQEGALMAAAPIGKNTLGRKRSLLTSSVAVMAPFSTQELFMRGEALYYGVNALSGNMIMADRKKLRTPNGVILGKPGSGKSFAGKREILTAFLMTKDHVVVCDPESEYFLLVKELGGTVIRLASDSGQYINPLDIQASHINSTEAMEIKTAFIFTLCDVMAGSKYTLGSDEKGIIDKCIKQIYGRYFENPAPENMPILEDLYDELLEYNDVRAKYIADCLYIFVHGSQNYFNHRTSVDSENRVVCFDIRDLSSQLNDIGMLVIQDAVWNRVSRNRELGTATRYFCDEFHRLLSKEQTAAYAVDIWKRFRKWGGIPTAITQNVSDFLRSMDIEAILGNSDFICLLSQSSGDQMILKEKLQLSKEQLAYVTDAEQGCGLIKFDNIVIPFRDRYPTDTKSYAIMTTKPEEMMKIRQGGRQYSI